MMDSTRHHYAFRFAAEPELLDDADRLRATIIYEAEAGGATVLHSFGYSFDPQGATAFALLAESHVSIHTWPEEGVAELDVFTCGDSIDPFAIGRAIVRSLGGSLLEYVEVDTRPL